MAARSSVLQAQSATTVWPADTLKDAVSNQSLQDRLEMPRRKPVLAEHRYQRY
jgi:hypothetical protein